ncbi:MAG: heme-binding protein [Fuerstiella sp.]|nr:heme-binding protein [Fuerstiella sp.]
MMNGKSINYFVAGGVLATLLYFGWNLTSRSAYESAAYSVIQSEGPFEVREYPQLLLATTEMRFASQGNDGSFGRLFSYISGANENNQQVAMTTPVFMDAASKDNPGQMGFVVPASVVANGAPVPSDGNVELRSRNGGRFAVIRFNGRLDNSTRRDAEQRLSQWTSDQGLSAGGDAESAGYDPPWTPGPWRRNEVLIRLK